MPASTPVPSALRRPRFTSCGGIQRRIDGVHLVEVLVQAHAASLVVADLDGLDLVDFGMVVHADDGFIYFHGHGAPSRKNGRYTGIGLF